MTSSEQIRAYYLEPAPMTKLPEGFAEELPRDTRGLFGVIQGLLMHQFWAGAYGETLTPARIAQTDVRSTRAMLALMHEADAAPLCEPRAPSQRVIGVCRHFSVLGVALLRRHGVPARARCGFGLYFDGAPVDHWVIEYWDGATWKLGDAQMDEVQRSALKLPFDPLDVPRDQFLVGGEAWRRCRSGEADPGAFGILDMHGLWFVAGNLVRDIAALNNMELLPWDVWGAMFQPGEEPAPERLAAFDPAIPLSLDPDANFERLRTFYDQPDWRVPDQVLNAKTQQLEAA